MKIFKFFIKMFYFLILLMLMTQICFGATYVRPISGEYGLEDGSDYDNAFDGFAGINWGGISGGNTLYVCGEHNEGLSIGAAGSSGNYITIDFNCPNDKGSISGLTSFSGNWVLESGTVYSATLVTETMWVVYNDVVLQMDNGQTTSVGANTFDWDSNTLYLNVGENPTLGTVQVSNLNRLVQCGSGDEYIYIKNGSISYANEFCIFNFAAENNIFDSNIVTYCFSDGISSSIGAGNSIGNNSIINNTAIDCKNGIDVNRGNNFTISGNVVYQTLSWWENLPANSGINIRDDDRNGNSYENLIEKNHIYNHRGDGLMIRASDSNIIRDNIIHYCQNQIELEDSDRNEIYNNTLYNTRKNGHHSILLLGDDFGNGKSPDLNIIKNNMIVQTKDPSSIYNVNALGYDDSENTAQLFSNYSFDSGDTDWTYTGTPIFSGGEVDYDGTQGVVLNLTQNFGSEDSINYYIEYKYNSRSIGGVRAAFGNGTYGNWHYADGTYSEYFTTNDNAAGIGLQINATFDGNIEYVAVYQVGIGNVIDSNLIYLEGDTGTGNLINWANSTQSGEREGIMTWEEWQNFESNKYDQNSINSAPLFISTINFHLQSLSPARDAGTNDYYSVGDVDFYGAKRKYGSNVDIGAVEWFKRKFNR